MKLTEPRGTLATVSSAGGIALELADEIRVGTSHASAFDIWLAARDAACGRDGLRRELFRHAMIHAGFLRRRSVRCPVCKLQLR